MCMGQISSAQIDIVEQTRVSQIEIEIIHATVSPTAMFGLASLPLTFAAPDHDTAVAHCFTTLLDTRNGSCHCSLGGLGLTSATLQAQAAHCEMQSPSSSNKCPPLQRPSSNNFRTQPYQPSGPPPHQHIH